VFRSIGTSIIWCQKFYNYLNLYLNIKKNVRGLIIKEERRHKRIQIAIPIIYAYQGKNKVVIKYGTSFDFSNSGMCFYTNTPLHEELKLQVHSSYIWDYPKPSIVRWCSRKYLNFYKVGVSFQ
jgi:hypothetical protein